MPALRLTPVASSFEDLYESVLASIPAGAQWHRGPVVLPLTANRTPFTLEGTEGDVVEITRNGTFIDRVVLTGNSQQINIFLLEGKNFLVVRTNGEQWLLLVVAANYATVLRGFSQEYFFNVDVDFQDTLNQLNSDLSLRHVEHQIDFQELLPPTRALRALAGKLAVRSLINETGSTRGVDDIVTAASNTTPIVRETVVNRDLFEPSVYTVFSRAHDLGGHEFHIWVPNICVGTWAAFVKLMDNLDPAIAELTSVTDEKVSLNFLGRPESHLFEFETDACSMIALITQDCLPIVVSIQLTVETEIAFCAWVYPFDVVVELALGRFRLDSSLPFSEVFLAASILIDATGSETGVIGAAFVDLSRPPARIVSVTVITPIGPALVPAFALPGTRRLVLPSGSPGRDITVRYETSIPFDLGISLDSCEEADPLCDGWYGTPLVGRLDGDACLDTMVPEATLFADLECCFTRPQATLLGASLATIDLSNPVTASAGLVAGFAPVGGSPLIIFP